ncbi:hypothetical protein HOLleu_34910 [Holothuria leucospilota]|uniref:G-protein coupled receptors family 1 profile domain-containing protein n=1 Tax=Holothuria leucospilota TaxID=206669 RepID=A0A9Q1BFQ0_HOLLE|nr:hypothetical protein HOLleu_34910 [Holothuria leucospilota]
MTIDRFLCIVYPFSSTRFNRLGAIVACSVMWYASLGYACLTLLGRHNEWFYGHSDVCLGLPIVAIVGGTGKKSTWILSTIIYTYISSFCLIIVIICYVSIFIAVKRTRSGSDRQSEARNEDIKLAKRMSVIVGTDMLCWLPVIILSVLTRRGIAIPTELNPWLVVFVIPINSVLNPFIYSYPIIKGRKKNESRVTHG